MGHSKKNRKHKMAANMEFDSPWKNILEHFFEAFISFCFPTVYDLIDWTRGYEFLEQELQKVVRDATTKERRVDKLVKVWRRNGTEVLLYIHIEVQAQYDADFPERMFIYHYRLYDRYGQRVLSLAVLGDKNPNWRPNSYSYGDGDCQLSFQFPIIKLFDYWNDWDTLESSTNPIAIVIRIHLMSLETSESPEWRYEHKVELFQTLYKANYSKTEILELYRFLDWVLALPEELEQQFDDLIEQYEEGNKVQYVTSIERRGLKRGLQQGILQHAQVAVIENLKARFEVVPESLVKMIQAIEDQSLLSKLHREAIFVSSLEGFE